MVVYESVDSDDAHIMNIVPDRSTRVHFELVGHANANETMVSRFKVERWPAAYQAAMICRVVRRRMGYLKAYETQTF